VTSPGHALSGELAGDDVTSCQVSAAGWPSSGNVWRSPLPTPAHSSYSLGHCEKARLALRTRDCFYLKIPKKKQTTKIDFEGNNIYILIYYTSNNYTSFHYYKRKKNTRKDDPIYINTIKS
jgi:hypothetical protein